ncbi:MAG: hypothetical protein ACLFRP_07640 [Puniceicoccaceae bacterium]
MTAPLRIGIFVAAALFATAAPAAAAPEETARPTVPSPPPGALPEPIGGGIPEEDQEEIRKPITLFLEGGREFTGDVAKVEDGAVSLRVVQEGGEIVLSFPKADIREIFFPGGNILERTRTMVEEGRLAEALPYLEALIARRFPLFDLIPEEGRSLYAAIPMAALAIDRPAQAIAYANALSPYMTLREDAEAMRDAELLGRYILELNEEAMLLARQWIEEEGRYGPSALGYFILGALLFAGEDYEGALRTALEPIVFSGQIPMSYLPHCYSLAIASAHALEDEAHRDRLLAEARERGFAWQPLRVLGGAGDDLEGLVIEDDEGEPLPLFEATTDGERLLEDREESVGTGNFVDPSRLIPL